MLSWTEKPSPSQKAGWANWHDSMGCQKKMNPYWPLAKRLAEECIWLIGIRHELPGWCVSALAQGSG